MANQRETNSYENQVDEFTEALATARKMQQDWLNYGLNFIHLYVEDVDGDWLETWRNEEILNSPLLDTIKGFLVSDDDVAVRIRQYLGEQSSVAGVSLALFDLAVNLQECWRIREAHSRLSAVKNLLAVAGNKSYLDINDDVELWHLTNSLLAKLAEIL